MLTLEHKTYIIIFLSLIILILTIRIDYNFIRVLVNNNIFNVIFLLLLIAVTMYNINIGFVWILIYLIIRQRYINTLSRYQNVTFDTNTPESPCGISNHEQCLHNAFNKPDSPSGLTLKDARINCCNEAFEYNINNMKNPSSYSEAISKMAILPSPSPKCKCNPDEINKQVCVESNNLPCVKAGLASSVCLTIDGIVSLCNDSTFVNHFTDQEKINNNPRLSFYNTIQYHDGLNKK